MGAREPGVGVMPPALGEGVTPRPHGRAWSSIREAGRTAAYRGAWSRKRRQDRGIRGRPGRSGHGREGEPAQEADPLEPEGTGCWVRMVLRDGQSPPLSAEWPPLRPSPKRAPERRHPAPALRRGASTRSRGRRPGVQGGMASDAKALRSWQGSADRRPLDGHGTLRRRAHPSCASPWLCMHGERCLGAC
jgi:hypothetical protein